MRIPTMLRLFAVTLSAAVVGCLEPSAISPEGEAGTSPQEVNTSDPRKPDFTPELETAKIERSYEEMLDHTPGYRGLKDFQTRPRTSPLLKAASPERWVGVLPVFQNGWDACPEANRVHIHQDDEDNNNANSTSGTLPFGAGDGDTRNTGLRFCKVPGNTLTPLTDNNASTDNAVTQEYAVLKLDDECPQDSYEFGVRVDNEDNNNRNSAIGNYWPNYQNSDYTELRFCHFKAWVWSSIPRRFPNLPYVGGDYAVFTNLNISGDVIKQKYWVTSDDEDNGNLNTFLWFGQTAGDQVRAKKIVNTIRSGTSKTTYYMAAVKP